ncbi:ankyrin repeat protein [Fusarium avenaceum]|nr:ankyrin repeat protein [Fusarium avenaceum]
MHGLDAQSPKTWIAWKKEDDPDSGNVNWLCDEHMLPQSMNYTRILTYDWNANYDTTASSDRFLGHADTLLDRVYVNREELGRLQIPLIFVASCFSGLLLAQALVRASERYHPRGLKYRQVLDFTIGVAFLGTPFLGSWDLGYSIADLRVAVAIESGGEYNRELMEYLRQGTAQSPGPLDDLVQRFSEMIHHKDFKFGKVCFYETRHTNFSAYRKKLPESYAARLDANGHGIVVTKNSACLRGVEGVALDVRHNMLHKFNSPENDGFRRLVSRLKSFVEEAENVLSFNGYGDSLFGTDILLKEKEETDRRAQCFKALHFDDIDYEPGRIVEPGDKACQWLLEDRSYSNWHNNGRGILWILGNPGSGKSTLIKHAIHGCRENTTPGSAHTLSFFFHNQGKLLQHTAEGLLRALLYQLLERFPEQTRTFSERFDTQKTKSPDGTVWRTSYLMRHLEACLEKVVERYDLRVFVDALDECRVEDEEGDDETQEIRDLIRKLQEVEQRLRSSPHKLSLCFACRHYPNLARPGVDNHIIAEQGNGRDIKDFVHEELLREITLDEEKGLRESLEKEIVHSALGNFLWVTLVTSRAISMHRNYEPALLEEVQKIPSKISQIYESTISTLIKGNPDVSLRLFQWLCFAKRPLELQELRSAINIIPDALYKCFKDIPGPFWGKTDLGMEKVIRTLSGGLAKVGNSNEVVFIHLSVKDYLLRSGFRILDPTLHTSRDMLKAGHDVLLATCLWLITEADFEDTIDMWMKFFTKPIIRITLGALPSDPAMTSKLEGILRKYLPDLGENPRFKVDAMDRSSRHYLQQYLNPNNAQELHLGYPQGHRQGIYTGELEEWLLIDEIMSCYLGLKMLAMPSSHAKDLAGYCHEYWCDHAVQSLENGSEDAINKGLDNLFSRAQSSLLYFYSLAFCPLQQAAALRNPTVLGGLLNKDTENHFPVNSTSLEEGFTALMIASEKGHEDNVRILLQQDGIQVDMKDFKGQTALLKAVDSNRKRIVELLIKNNANMDLQDSDGTTALVHSVQNDRDEIMELLLQHGANTHVEDTEGLTAFDCAIEKGKTLLCRHVLEKTTEQERLGLVSPKRMAMACRKGHVDIVRLFLENGAKTGIPESQARSQVLFSETALGAAIKTDQRAVLELLLDHESTHTGLPVWRTNLLCESVRNCAMECMMSLIIHYGWEIDEIDANGDMPVHVAIREGWARHVNLSPFCDVIKTLISLDWSPQGVVVNSLNNQLQSPLMLAIGYCGTDRFVKQILADERVDINAQGPAGTALWCSVARKRHTVTECLLSYRGINPNLGLSNGVTPLQAAILHGDVKSVSLLLGHKSIMVTEKERYLLNALRGAPDESFWAVLHGFVGETEHLYGYWTVEPMDDRRAALAEIQTLVETWISVGEQCSSQTQQSSAQDREEDDTLHSSVNILWLLLYRGNGSW